MKRALKEVGPWLALIIFTFFVFLLAIHLANRPDTVINPIKEVSFIPDEDRDYLTRQCGINNSDVMWPVVIHKLRDCVEHAEVQGYMEAVEATCYYPARDNKLIEKERRILNGQDKSEGTAGN